MAIQRAKDFSPLRASGQAVTPELLDRNLDRIKDLLRSQISEYRALFESVPSLYAATYAAARLLTGVAGQSLLVGGRTTAHDGGEGQFVWRLGVATDNDGTIIAGPSGSGGYWERVYSVEVDLRWFGADVTGTADCATIFASVTTEVNRIGGGVIIFRAGTYLLATRGSYFRATSNRVILRFQPGAKIKTTIGPAVAGVADNFVYGEIEAGDYQEIFDFSSTYIPKLFPGVGGLNNPGIALNPYWFGAYGNNHDSGVTSETRDTLAWQRVFDQASSYDATLRPNGLGGRMAYIHSPGGNFSINSTLEFGGGSIRLISEYPAALDGSGTQLKWFGAAQGVICHIKGGGISNLHFEGVAVHGGTSETVNASGAVIGGANTGAKWGWWLEEYITHITFERCAATGFVTEEFGATGNNDDESVGWVFGELSATGTQCDDIIFKDCVFGTGCVPTKFIAGNNCLDFTWIGGQIGYGKIRGGWDCQLNGGPTRISDVFMGSCFEHVIRPGTLTYIHGLRVEADRFNGAESVMICDTASNVSPGSYMEIVASQFFVNGPADNFCMRYEGALFLRGNKFINKLDIGGAPFLLKVGGTDANPSQLLAYMGSCVSEQNFYHYATDVAPLYDGSGNPYLLPKNSNDYRRDANNTQWGYMVRSEMDTGGDGNIANFRMLRACRNYFVSSTMMQLTTPRADSATYAQTKSGMEQAGTNVTTVTYVEFQTAALFIDYEVFSLQPGDKLTHCEASVTTPFAGPAGTLQLRLGITSGGNELLLDTDIKTAAIDIGSAAAHLGAALATTVQGGVVFDRGASTPVYARLTSSAGNLSGLTAGVVKFCFTTGRIN